VTEYRRMVSVADALLHILLAAMVVALAHDAVPEIVAVAAVTRMAIRRLLVPPVTASAIFLVVLQHLPQGPFGRLGQEHSNVRARKGGAGRRVWRRRALVPRSPLLMLLILLRRRRRVLVGPSPTRRREITVAVLNAPRTMLPIRLPPPSNAGRAGGVAVAVVVVVRQRVHRSELG
jgi:hypothetical protein